MKKHLTYLIIGMVAMNAACTDKDDLDATSDTAVPLSINAVTPGNGTRVTFTDNTTADASSYDMKVEWAAGDNVLLTNADASKSCKLTAQEAGHSATFSTPTSTFSPATGDQVFSYFPSTMASKSLNNFDEAGTKSTALTGNYYVDYSAAGGTDPAAIANKAVMYATDKYSDPQMMYFKNATAVVRLKLNFGSKDIANKIDTVQIYSAKCELVTSAYMNVATDGTITWRLPKSGVVKIPISTGTASDDGTLTLYVMAIPQAEVPELSILATSSADKSAAYFAELTSKPTFTAGGMCGIVKDMTAASVTLADATTVTDNSDVWVVYGKSSALVKTALTSAYTANNARRINLIMPEYPTFDVATAFKACYALQKVYMPALKDYAYTLDANSTKTYVNAIFTSDTHLTSLCFPNLTMLPGSTIWECTSLTTLNFPNVTNAVNLTTNHGYITKLTFGSKLTVLNGGILTTPASTDLYIRIDQGIINYSWAFNTSTGQYYYSTWNKQFKSITRQ